MPLQADTNALVGSYEPVSTQPSLGLCTSFDPPRFRQIPPGAIMSVILDPKHPDSMTCWRLTRVTAREWYWECACTVPGCTRTAVSRMSYKGVHPSRER